MLTNVIGYTSINPEVQKLPSNCQVLGIYATAFNPRTFTDVRVKIEEIYTRDPYPTTRQAYKVAVLQPIDPHLCAFEAPVDKLRKISFQVAWLGA